MDAISQISHTAAND